MKKEKRLDRKIYCLFKTAGYPRWLHHYGPKKFQSWLLCLGLVIKQVYQLSYRRAAKFLAEFYDVKLHFTTLQKAARRFPRAIWQSLLTATIDFDKVYLAAADGTGFSRTGASQYYLKRIDGKDPVKRHVQAITLVDVKRRKFLAGTFFAKPHGEAKRIPTLHKQSCVKPEILLMDKGFDCEDLHQWLNKHGTFSVAPVRKGCKRGRHRKLMRDCFDWCLYWQRNIVECLFSALKRLFGATVKYRKSPMINAEMFCRLIAYNIGANVLRLFLQSL
ncbi:MAG: transposase [archaeon]